MLAFVVVLDGAAHRRHDARERRLQRRHDHLRAAHAALVKSMMLAIELHESRSLLLALANSLPPALVPPIGREEFTLRSEFRESIAEASSWMATIRHEVDGHHFEKLVAAADVLMRRPLLGKGRNQRLEAYIDAVQPITKSIQQQLRALDISADDRRSNQKWHGLMGGPDH